MKTAAKRLKYKALFTNASEQGGGWHFLVVDRETANKFKFEGSSRRIICTIKGGEPFPCALMPWGDIFYIMVNKQRRSELGLEVGQKVDIVLEKDDSKYGMPMPEELQEVLNQDPDGEKMFEKLTPGKKRSMMYHIGTINDIDKRIHTALIFVEHIKKNDGKIIYEQLTKELKRPLF
ncbi:MAG TPA: YdeI/OmpD-associated family protein [Pyrinomonadaceae bacterium]|nr:YdeI/OmpD-associated family protein [Pyrinomonadaceae bacterium]